MLPSPVAWRMNWLKLWFILLSKSANIGNDSSEFCRSFLWVLKHKWQSLQRNKSSVCFPHSAAVIQGLNIPEENCHLYKVLTELRNWYRMKVDNQKVNTCYQPLGNCKEMLFTLEHLWDINNFNRITTDTSEREGEKILDQG